MRNMQLERKTQEQQHQAQVQELKRQLEEAKDTLNKAQSTCSTYASEAQGRQAAVDALQLKLALAEQAKAQMAKECEELKQTTTASSNTALLRNHDIAVQELKEQLASIKAEQAQHTRMTALAEERAQASIALIADLERQLRSTLIHQPQQKIPERNTSDLGGAQATKKGGRRSPRESITADLVPKTNKASSSTTSEAALTADVRDLIARFGAEWQMERAALVQKLDDLKHQTQQASADRELASLRATVHALQAQRQSQHVQHRTHVPVVPAPLPENENENVLMARAPVPRKPSQFRSKAPAVIEKQVAQAIVAPAKPVVIPAVVTAPIVTAPAKPVVIPPLPVSAPTNNAALTTATANKRKRASKENTLQSYPVSAIAQPTYEDASGFDMDVFVKSKTITANMSTGAPEVAPSKATIAAKKATGPPAPAKAAPIATTVVAPPKAVSSSLPMPLPQQPSASVISGLASAIKMNQESMQRAAQAPPLSAVLKEATRMAVPVQAALSKLILPGMRFGAPPFSSNPDGSSLSKPLKVRIPTLQNKENRLTIPENSGPRNTMFRSKITSFTTSANNTANVGDGNPVIHPEVREMFIVKSPFKRVTVPKKSRS